MKSEKTYSLISVVMATYNGERFLAEQIESVLLQTYPNIELIIIDDVSTDGTVSIIQSYIEENSNLRLYVNEENLGYIKNFEKGMLLAEGGLIALCDQDDIWVTDKLKILFEEIEQHEIVYSNSELIDESGHRLGKKMSDIRNQLSYDDCLMYTIGAWAPAHAMLIKKELVERCLPFPSLVTHDFWLGFVATCKGPIKYLPLQLVYYRQHNSNAIGANTHKSNTQKPSAKQKRQQSRARMQLLFEKCPAEKIVQKKVLETINLSYQNFSLKNNWIRMITFFSYRDKILAYKKKSEPMKWLFCLKMFFKID